LLFQANAIQAPKKKVASAPFSSAKKAPKKAKNPVIEKRTKNFGIGNESPVDHPANL
jgi:hypothetical protein